MHGTLPALSIFRVAITPILTRASSPCDRRSKFGQRDLPMKSLKHGPENSVTMCFPSCFPHAPAKPALTPSRPTVIMPHRRLSAEHRELFASRAV